MVLLFVFYWLRVEAAITRFLLSLITFEKAWLSDMLLFLFSWCFLIHSGSWILNPSTADIWGRILLCCARLSCALEGLSQPLWPLFYRVQQHTASRDKVFLDIGKCPFGGKSLPQMKTTGLEISEAVGCGIWTIFLDRIRMKTTTTATNPLRFSCPRTQAWAFLTFFSLCSPVNGLVGISFSMQGCGLCFPEKSPSYSFLLSPASSTMPGTW